MVYYSSMDNDSHKKILYLITLSHYGGAQKYIHILARAMKDRGHTVSVALGAGGPFLDHLYTDSIATHVIPSLKRSISPIQDLKAFFALIRLFRKERPDVLHITSSKTGLLGTIAGRITGVPKIVFCIQGLPFIDTSSWNVLSRLWMRFSFFITFIFSDQIISVSKIMSDHISSWPTVSKKLSLIYNSVAVPDFLQREQARTFFSDKIGKDISKMTLIGTLAELRKNKGIRYLIEAAHSLIQKYPNTLFIVCGDGPERNSLERQIALAHLTDHFYLLGHVDHASRYLPGFDMFVLPSLTEALSLALLEVGHAGLPTVATNVAGTPEIIIDQKTGLLIPDQDSEAIATALRTYIEHEEMQKNHAAGLHKHISEHFSVEQMIEKTLAVYRS